MAALQAPWLADDFEWFRAVVVALCLLIAWRTLRRSDDPDSPAG